MTQSVHVRENLVKYSKSPIAVSTKVPEYEVIESQPLPFLDPPDDILGTVP
mgnify:CR=1 FL=1